eukprot:scaffold127375_cov18-Tisochrysis_lutea.AAC.1
MASPEMGSAEGDVQPRGRAALGVKVAAGDVRTIRPLCNQVQRNSRVCGVPMRWGPQKASAEGGEHRVTQRQ